jgi:hypothetical protein
MSSGGSKDGPSADPASQAPASQSDNNSSTEKKPLPLLESSKEGEAITLSVGGEGVKLDHLGPLVVHQDGTMSRISNWAEMSELEKENTLRIIGKRNQSRLKKLREEPKDQ